MAVVRELVATFELDVDEQSFDKAERSIDGVIRGAKILGGLFAGGVVAAGFSRVIDLASDATEDLNLLSVVFGERLTPSILEWANTTSKAVNQSEFELRKFVGTAQAMLAPMLGGADAAAQFSTEIVQAAIDLESLRNVPLPQAFQKIQSALANQSEPLGRLGIDTRELAFDQFLMSRGIAASSKELSLQEKNLQRVRFVLSQLSDAQGDAAKTANDFKNVQRGIASGVRDITTRIGQLFLPALTKSFIETRKNVVAIRDWIEQNEEWLQQNIGGAFETLVQVIDNTAKGIVQAVRFFGDLVDRMPPLVKGILAAAAAVTAFVAILSLPGAPFIALLGLIGLIIDDLVVFGEGGESVIGDLVEAIQGFLPGAEGALESLSEFFSELWDSIKETGEGAWEFITELFTGGTGDLLGSMVALFKEGAAAIGKFFDDAFDIDTEKSLADLQVFIARARNTIAGLLRNPVVKLLLRLVAARLGAAAGEFVGEGVSQLVTSIIPQNRITRALGLDELVQGVTKQIVGGISSVAGAGIGFGGAGDFAEGLADVVQTDPGFSSVAQMTSAGVGAFSPAMGGGQMSVNDNSSQTNNITLQTQANQSNQEIAELIPGALEAFREESQAERRAVLESFVPSTPSTPATP